MAGLRRSTRRSATAWPSAPTPTRIALLDNFCWGNTERPETLGSLVLAAQACHDVALAYGTPFISGKDSLNNEYTHDGQSLAIPPTLLISAIGQVPDVRRCVTMDLKEPGNLLVAASGTTRHELGGSHWADGPAARTGARCPRVDPELGPALFRAVHAAIQRGLVRSCHDLSEGGLAVALAEMALRRRPRAPRSRSATCPATTTRRTTPSCCSPNRPRGSCSKSGPSTATPLADLFGGLPLGRLGEVTGGRRTGGPRPRLTVTGLDGSPVIDAPVADLKAAWQRRSAGRRTAPEPSTHGRSLT